MAKSGAAKMCAEAPKKKVKKCVCKKNFAEEDMKRCKRKSKKNSIQQQLTKGGSLSWLTHALKCFN